MVKVLTVIGLFALSIGATYYFELDQGYFSKLAKSTLYARQVNISGQKFLAKENLLKALDHSFNNITWRLQPDQVLTQLEELSLIRSADLTPCSWYSLKCFNLQIVERVPAMVARLDTQIWLLSADGGFLLELPKSLNGEKLKRLRKKTKVPVVVGLDRGHPASAIVQSRAQYINRSLQQIRKATELDVSAVELLDQGELVVRIVGYPFKVRFSSSFDNQHVLDTELERLKQLITAIANYKGAIEQIDLAYNRMAVVKLTDAAVAARASLKLSDKIQVAGQGVAR